uniref:GDNF/GAS1 domain-containing protein n=1 Tax=Gouania willdenowi TaxID=441366 RepID=A0A8C5E7Z3_GOUWI
CRCVLLVLFQLLSFSVCFWCRLVVSYVVLYDCLVAEQGCIQEQSCMILYRLLEYCTAEEAVSPLSSDARLECLEAQNSLQRHRPLQVCKCQRGSRREEPCLRVYWTVRFAASASSLAFSSGNANILVIFYVSRGSSLSIDGQNQCLKAAQDCGLYEKCGSLRSEYVVACTKRTTASDNSCNRQKCHKALRRFLERVPEEYSFALLFCPCSDTLCGERRRKTIVPSCSYEENVRGEDRVGKSRFADFQQNCQPSPLSPSGCVRESRAMCLKAYAGLIGTIMTPNYVSNSSTEVSQWCTCDGSGNELQACQRILHMFSNNKCLLHFKNTLYFILYTFVISYEVMFIDPSPTLHILVKVFELIVFSCELSE